jgi:hypothetical protein
MPSHLQLQVLVGPAVARGHLALRGVRGPRFILDEETCRVHPANGRWRRYQGSHQVSRNPAEGIVVSEVAWWQNMINIEDEVGRRRERVEGEIRRCQQEKLESAVRPLWERDQASMEKRQVHLRAFEEMLEDDPV